MDVDGDIWNAVNPVVLSNKKKRNFYNPKNHPNKMKKENEEFAEAVVVILPQEVQTLALAVPEKKREEVENVLAGIFQGTADWKKQVEALVINGVDDTMNISLADTYRLNVKKARLAAEKVFDAKREEVQALMAGFKTEDALWLKSKQVMQILFKEIEDLAEHKAKFVQRYEQEQKNLRTESRRLKVAEFSSEVSQVEYESMSDATFEAFLGGLKSAKAEKDAAEKLAAEAEIKKQEAQKLHTERKESLMEFWPYVDSAVKQMDLSSVDEKEWANLCATVKDAKVEYERQLKKKEEENALLKKQADEQKVEFERKQKAAEELKAKQDSRQKSMFDMGLKWNGSDFFYADINFNWTDLLCMTDADFDKAVAGASKRMQQIKADEKKAKDKAEADRLAAIKKQQELEAELKKKKDDEAAALKKKQDEEAASEKAKQAAMLAPRKQKLEAWINGFVMGTPVGMQDDAVVKDVLAKFDGFKKWAKSEIDKLV